MRVVLDTNVLFAALVSDGLCREILRRVAGVRGLVLSAEILAELEDVVSPKLPTDPRVERFLRDLRTFVTFVEPAQLGRAVSRDKADDMVIGTAVAAQATHLVSGDEDLLVVRRYGRIRIVSPRSYTQWLDRKRVPYR